MDLCNKAISTQKPPRFPDRKQQPNPASNFVCPKKNSPPSSLTGKAGCFGARVNADRVLHQVLFRDIQV